LRRTHLALCGSPPHGIREKRHRNCGNSSDSAQSQDRQTDGFDLCAVEHSLIPSPACTRTEPSPINSSGREFQMSTGVENWMPVKTT
jgi:hypothetical protein